MPNSNYDKCNYENLSQLFYFRINMSSEELVSCDTFIVMRDSTVSGETIFGKNSDRFLFITAFKPTLSTFNPPNRGTLSYLKSLLVQLSKITTCSAKFS